MFLNGNFVALPSFQRHYGVPDGKGGFVIPTRWQSALFQAGQCGAFVGVFLAGPITNKLGYRWTTMFALMLMNATIFISFFVSRPARLAPKLNSADPKPFCFLSLGQFPCSLNCWSSAGGCSMGFLHCQLPRLCI
jgi:MFS family permease